MWPWTTTRRRSGGGGGDLDCSARLPLRSVHFVCAAAGIVSAHHGQRCGQMHLGSSWPALSP